MALENPPTAAYIEAAGAAAKGLCARLDEAIDKDYL